MIDQRHGAHDRVGDVDELNLKRADLKPVAGTDDVQLRALLQVVLFEAAPHQRQRELSAVDRDVQLPEQERDGPDVVFMPVGQQQRPDVRPVLLQIGEVGDHDVHAQELLFREHHPGVDDDDVVPVAQGQAVHAELAEPAQGDHLQLAIRHMKDQRYHRLCPFLSITYG